MVRWVIPNRRGVPRFNLPLLPQEKGAKGMRYLLIEAPDMRTQRVKLTIAESLF